MGSQVYPSLFSGHAKSPDSIAAAKEIRDGAGRRDSIPVRTAFVRGSVDLPPPMSQIYQGGRSGEVAIKLYLGLIWRAAQPPFDTCEPFRAWATLLDLPDPDGSGARRIADAAKKLENHKLIVRTPRPGHPPRLTLLEESGTGAAYTLPSSASSRAKNLGQPVAEQARHWYFKVPDRLWTLGYIQALRGPGLTLLLVLLSERNSTSGGAWFSQEQFASRYHLSPSTRNKGKKELMDLDLLYVSRERLGAHQHNTVFAEQRKRNVYALKGDAIGSATDN